MIFRRTSISSLSNFLDLIQLMMISSSRTAPPFSNSFLIASKIISYSILKGGSSILSFR
jgi:hypothetical protein